MSPDDVRRWAAQYKAAWESADSQAVASLFADDGTYRDNIYEEPHRGRSGVIGYWEGVTAPQSEVTVTMGDPYVDGQRAVVEFWTNMHIADNPVTLAGALLLEFNDDGMCRSLREYWNFIDGTHQPPEGWGS